MSRFYRGGTTNRHSVSQLGGGQPLTIAGWVKPGADITTEQGLVSLAVDANNGFFVEIFSGNLLCMISDAANYVFSTKAVSALRWQHFAAVYTSTTSRTAYVDGIAGTAETSLRNPSGIGIFGAGCFITTTSQANPSLGVQLCNVGYWNGVALSASQVRQLALGAVLPFAISPSQYTALHIPPTEPVASTSSFNRGTEGGFPWAQIGSVPMINEYPPMLRRPRPFMDLNAVAATGRVNRLSYLGVS